MLWPLWNKFKELNNDKNNNDNLKFDFECRDDI